MRVCNRCCICSVSREAHSPGRAGRARRRGRLRGAATRTTPECRPRPAHRCRSTHAVEVSRALSDRGDAYLDALLTGTHRDIESGVAALLASGSSAAFEQANPLLKAIGGRVFYTSRPQAKSAMVMLHTAWNAVNTRISVALRFVVWHHVKLAQLPRQEPFGMTAFGNRQRGASIAAHGQKQR
jgi:hypothetical protein